MIPPLDHLSEFALCVHKLRTVITYHQLRLSSDGEESSQSLHKFNGRIIYSQLQVCRQELVHNAWWLCFGSYLRCTVQSSHMLCNEMEAWTVPSELWAGKPWVAFQFVLQSLCRTRSELYRLGQIMSSYDPKQFVVIFATVVATPACPIWWKCRVIRRDIQCSRGSVALCLETKASSTRPPTLIIPFLSLNGRAVGDLLFVRRSWSVFCGFL